MDEEQFAVFLQQAFEQADRENSVEERTAQALILALLSVRALLEELPDGLLREQAWQRMLPQVQAALEPYASRLSSELFSELAAMAPTSLDGASQLARIAAPFVLLSPQSPEVLQAIMNTRVGSRRLSELFAAGQQGSPFVRETVRTIDRTVRLGILKGLTTAEIADQVVGVSATPGAIVATTRTTGILNAARSIRANARAITRTAIQDADRLLKDVFYKSNDRILQTFVWEWVAVLDSRTCPTCAPLDGDTWDTQIEAPTWPIHINCRCQLVPVQPSAPPIKIDYPDFLAQSTPEIQEGFFGDGEAGTKRASTFRRLLDRGLSPDKALQKMIDIRDGVGYFKSPDYVY